MIEPQASIGSPTLWIGFTVFILAVLSIDLGVFNRKSHAVTTKEAISWTTVWTSLAGLFGAGIYFSFGGEKALEFMTGYLIEEALSVDNLFLFLVIFSFFAVPKKAEHRILFYGVVGAIVTRGAFVFLGVKLITRFEWVMYIFGAFLIATAVKLCFKQEKGDLSKNFLIKFAKKVLPVDDHYDGTHFTTIRDGKRFITPLLLAVIVIECTDVMFALDSIPAVFAITRDPFIVFTSNIFAVMGLRSMFFLISALLKKLIYLHYGLAAILGFVGSKMVLTDLVHVSTPVSLAVIIGVLALTVVLSLLSGKRHNPASNH